MLRKKYTIDFPAWVGRPYELTEERSIPWVVWLIEQWFLWAHEFIYPINHDLHYKLMAPFCYAYDRVIFPWAYKYERIDASYRKEDRFDNFINDAIANTEALNEA